MSDSEIAIAGGAGRDQARVAPANRVELLRMTDAADMARTIAAGARSTELEATADGTANARALTGGGARLTTVSVLTVDGSATALEEAASDGSAELDETLGVRAQPRAVAHGLTGTDDARNVAARAMARTRMIGAVGAEPRLMAGETTEAPDMAVTPNSVELAAIVGIPLRAPALARGERIVEEAETEASSVRARPVTAAGVAAV